MEQSQLDNIVNKVDIVETIKKYIELKQSGTYFEGQCPFRADCGTSFTVSPSKKIFYCFGCHATGDVISFIAKMGNMKRTTAACFLDNIRKIGIDPSDTMIDIGEIYGIDTCVADKGSKKKEE